MCARTRGVEALAQFQRQCGRQWNGMIPVAIVVRSLDTKGFNPADYFVGIKPAKLLQREHLQSRSLQGVVARELQLALMQIPKTSGHPDNEQREQ